MSVDRVSRAPDFDLIARAYRWLEYLSFGRVLERCRNHFLAQLADCRSALVLGDGDGRFLAALFGVNLQIEADAVDASPVMLGLLRRRAQAAIPDAEMRLRTFNSDALAFAPSRSYDLIVTHFFLDCLTQRELEEFCARITPDLVPSGFWLVSDFRVPPGAMRLPARVLIRSLYLGFRVLTGLRTTVLPDHAAALISVGFTRIAQRCSLGGVLATELWQLASKPQQQLNEPTSEYTSPMLPPQRSTTRAVDDPVPDPEPASPSLSGPDPGVFHHEPGEFCEILPDDFETVDE